MAQPSLELSVKAFDELSVREFHDLLELRLGVFVLEQQCFYPELDGRDPEAWHLLGWFEGKLGACARWYSRGGRIVLGRIATAAWGRGRGWGKQVLARALREVGTQDIELHAQAHLQAFYASFGFEARGAVFLEDGIPHVRMLRRPAPIIP